MLWSIRPGFRNYLSILEFVSRSGEVQGHLEGGALGDSEGSRGEVAAT